MYKAPFTATKLRGDGAIASIARFEAVVLRACEFQLLKAKSGDWMSPAPMPTHKYTGVSLRITLAPGRRARCIVTIASKNLSSIASERVLKTRVWRAGREVCATPSGHDLLHLPGCHLLDASHLRKP